MDKVLKHSWMSCVLSRTTQKVTRITRELGKFIFIEQCMLNNRQDWVYNIGTNRITTGLVRFVPEYWQTILFNCTRNSLRVYSKKLTLSFLCLVPSVPENGCIYFLTKRNPLKQRIKQKVYNGATFPVV